MSSTFSRRHFLEGLGTVAGASALTLQAADNADAIGLERESEEGSKPPLQKATVPFDGPHQAGIQTPVQATAYLMAFSLQDSVDRSKLRNFMRTWTTDARRMAEGTAPVNDLESELFEVPANLTITVGFGEKVFTAAQREAQKPEWLADLPAYPTDKLEDRWNGGDICLQICGDDAPMVSHAARVMVRNAAPFAEIKWIQTGFQNASGSLKKGQTPRNLFGQLDGTINPRTDEEFGDQVWIEEGPDWLRGGSAMVVRRIAMDMDKWDILDRPAREIAIGRTLSNGAPLGQKNEFDKADLAKTDEFGLPYIDPKSHVALAMPPKEFPHQKILRRVYNYDLALENRGEGTANTGLIFICYQKDPLKQFNEIQKRLAESDRLNQWITHIGSAVFVVPRGTAENEYWGQDLLED